jgi:predicted O-methyltransferase YrrM
VGFVSLYFSLSFHFVCRFFCYSVTASITPLTLGLTIYRRALAPLGIYKLRRMLEDGLPTPFQTPLEFLFLKRLGHEEQKAVDKVELIRSDVARQTRPFEVANPGGENPVRTAQQIAHRSSVTPEWGAFLFLCAESFRARTILELGSCAGISGCYLASSRHCVRFTTVEGSPALARLAKSNIRQVSDRAELVNALFDDALEEILPTMKDGIDLAYIDGQHEYEATLRYFCRVEPYLNKGALVIFDDIHWSEQMWQAWRVLKNQSGFAYTIDVGRFGLCLWDGSSSQPFSYKLGPHIGWFRKVVS